jgi:8-oxo-dGTP pyrophosphatase MutT (NUDIX family)
MTFLPIPERIIETPLSCTKFSPATEKAIEEIWQAERVKRPSLFNGKVFTVEKVADGRIWGGFTEYRLFMAQWQRPELFDELQIHALAVTGVLRTQGGVIWGRRSADSTQYPGIWELIPSGGVDDQSRNQEGQFDLIEQLVRELKEETGAEKEALEGIHPLCFFHDAPTHLFHFIAELRTSLSLAEISGLRSSLEHKEHSEITQVAPEELEKFASQQPPAFSRLTRIMLSHSSCGHLMGQNPA